MTDSKLPLPHKVAFSEMATYHAKCITQCFNLGDYFQPHFCYEVSVMQLHIFAINTI